MADDGAERRRAARVMMRACLGAIIDRSLDTRTRVRVMDEFTVEHQEYAVFTAATMAAAGLRNQNDGIDPWILLESFARFRQGTAETQRLDEALLLQLVSRPVDWGEVWEAVWATCGCSLPDAVYDLCMVAARGLYRTANSEGIDPLDAVGMMAARDDQ